jgi:hypothetical protein
MVHSGSKKHTHPEGLGVREWGRGGGLNNPSEHARGLGLTATERQDPVAGYI